MASASAQLEDLLGDYLTLGSNASSGEANTNHGLSNTLSDINSNWTAGYVKIALTTSATLADRFSSYTEVSGGNYSRAANDSNSSGYIAIVPSSGTNGKWENQYDISFPQASASWGTVRYAIFQYDDGISNFPLIACSIGTVTSGSPAGVAVGNNTTLTFNAGDLSFTIA
jgi:hypothetical protein